MMWKTQDKCHFNEIMMTLKLHKKSQKIWLFLIRLNEPKKEKYNRVLVDNRHFYHVSLTFFLNWNSGSIDYHISSFYQIF